MTEFTELRIYADGDWRVVGAEHDIVTELHTAAGAEAWDVLGASEADTLAWLAATANPGAAAALLRTDDDGKVTLEGLAVGRVGSSLIPALTDTYDVGSSLLWWREGYISQLNAVLFAEEQISLMGGWLMVPPDAGNLAGDVAPAATEVDFGKAMTPGHWILIWAKDAGGNLRKEYLQVGALVSGTTYNVTRDLAAAHGTDPAWSAGTPFCVLGTNGSGRIEINAYDTPRISVVRQGAAYNVQTEDLRLGDLTGISDPTLSPSGWGLYGQNVFLSGKIVAQTGSIGGWTIASGHLYAGSGGSRAGLQPATYPFYAGSETPASAPFRVTPAGALVATNATITGAVTATSGSFTGAVTAQTGSIGGWTIASGHLYAGSGGSRAGLQPASYPFYAGSETPASAPFRVTPAGALTATNATINGTIVAASNTVTLDANGISITGGSTTTNRLKFLLGADEFAYLIGRQESAGYAGFYRAELAVDGDSISYNAKVALSAAARTAGDYALFELFGLDGGDSYAKLTLDAGDAYNWYPTHATINGSRDLRIGGGLYVGSVVTDPAPGTITATGDITAARHIAKDPTNWGFLVDMSSTGGWANRGFGFGNGATSLGGFDALGSGASITYFYVGTSYNDSGAVRFYPATGDVRTAGGLYVGSLAGDPAAGWGYFVNGLYIGDSTNAYQTKGITVSQGTATNEILALKNTNVAHGMTTFTETDTFAYITPASSSGGISLVGLRAAGSSIATAISGWLGETASTTKANNGYGVVHIAAGIKSGSGVGLVGANGNLLSIASYTTTRFIFDADGDAFSDVQWLTFDTHDDLALLEQLEASFQPVRAEFGDWLNDDRKMLLDAGIVGSYNDDEGRAMINWTRLAMLHTGAIRQLGARLATYERELLRLGADPALLN